MAVYQHVWSTAKTSHQNRKDRAALLSQLGQAVRQVSARTCLVLAGDFNSSLELCSRLVGPCTCPDSRRPDSEGLPFSFQTEEDRLRREQTTASDLLQKEQQAKLEKQDRELTKTDAELGDEVQLLHRGKKPNSLQHSTARMRQPSPQTHANRS